MSVNAHWEREKPVMFFLKPFHFMNSAHFAQVFFLLSRFFCLRSTSSFYFGSFLLPYFSIEKKNEQKKTTSAWHTIRCNNKKAESRERKKKRKRIKTMRLGWSSMKFGAITAFESIAKRLAHKMCLNMTTWPMIFGFGEEKKEFHENAAIKSTWEFC